MNKLQSYRRGVALVYVFFVMAILIVVSSMGVDYGRAHLVKTQLRAAADASARAGASSLLQDPDRVVRLTKEFALKQIVDGSPLTLLDSDIQVGNWDSSTRTFTVVTGVGRLDANAVRVMAQRSAARGTGVPTMWARFTRKASFDVHAECVVMKVDHLAVNQNVQATANPFLSGMPAGTMASPNNPHNSPDFAGTSAMPRQSPELIRMPLVANTSLQFDGIDGVMRHDPNLAFHQPDGQLNSIGYNTNRAEHGISDIRGPINALVGVFLDDNAPNLTRAPSSLDFSTAASRDFNELRPALKQVFFIGDGLNSQGLKQNFVVPTGATRLYLASWDFFEWNNNAGYRNVRISRPGRLVTVK
ncbi:MAG TPA: pilus assembly protein TadG-related protein [Tepidisphaeraceae bacterium]|nr:pilus assembly protein TadG-related protein [Tepidisphaeraceae bacterium]